MDDDGFGARGRVWILDRRATTYWSIAGRVKRRIPCSSGKLWVTRERILLTIPYDVYIVTHATVVSITLFTGFAGLTKGLRFEANDQYDEVAVFWGPLDRTVNGLALRGWHVDEKLPRT